jgi:hypothetical protein
VASGRQTESMPVDHPVLGPAVSVFDDRRRSLGSLSLYVAFFLIGIMGVLMGQSDLLGGSTVLGWAEVAGGVILGVYSVQAAVNIVGRLRHPITLVVGRDGFECAQGNGPVRWDEVASVSDPASPPGQPRMLRVQLADPADFVVRHRLSLIDRYVLRVRHNDLYLGNGTRLPVAAVQAAMNERLAEFRRAGPDKAGTPTSAPRTRAPRPRRASRRGSPGRRPSSPDQPD